MTFDDLLHSVPSARLKGDATVPITGIAIDSRAVKPGDVFVAVSGTQADGHRFVPDALAAGAVAVVCERPLEISVPHAQVDDARQALAAMAMRWYENPGAALELCGITGTNGKSSTALMVHAIVNASTLEKLGVIGTLGWGTDELLATTHTTPDALALQRLLSEMKDDGCVGVVMEVSSHAVRQHRTWGLDFTVGIVTNVTHDHLDYHVDWEDYLDAKTEFARSLLATGRRRPDGVLVYWSPDPAARGIGEGFAGRRVSVGESDACDVYAADIASDLAGSRFTLHLQTGAAVNVSTRLLGTFVPVNAALAAAAAIEMGVEPDAIRVGLDRLDAIPGRFERLGGDDRPTVIIDYAHTADAFERILSTCRALGARRLTTVFGCGGDRDRSKRPLIGDAAQRLSDACILTTDNPRSEPVDQIIADIRSGMRDQEDVSTEPDRAAAIDAAINNSAAGDVVALLGKGHEDYQMVGSEKTYFSDRETARKVLQTWSAR